MNKATEYKDYFIRLEQDEYTPNPRTEWDNFGHMICWHSRYNLGDKHDYHDGEAFWLSMADDDTAEKFEQGNIKLQDLVNSIMDGDNLIILPLFLLDHSGLWMRTGRFAEDSADWDTSRVGYIYCTKQEVLENWNVRKLSAEVDSYVSLRGKEIKQRVTVAKAALRLLEAEVEVYSQYLSGDVWGYIITDDEGNEIDSLWGLFGYQYAKQEAESFVDRLLEDAAVEVQQERVGP